jgi:hypothetical protein
VTTLAASLVLVAGTLLAGGSAPLAVAALGFWHYFLYFLAFRYGAVPQAQFVRDAVIMKSAALAGFGWAVLASGPGALSLGLMAAGFALNAAAARVLGRERTYYGHELAGLPHARLSAFPYTVVPHPMLLGNMLAFGAPLLDAPFRQDWWPLSAAHVAANLGLLAMEARLPPLRRGVPPAGSAPRVLPAALAGVAAGGVAGAAAGAAGAFAAPPAAVAAVGALAGGYAIVMFRCYSGARSAPGGPSTNGGGTHG